MRRSSINEDYLRRYSGSISKPSFGASLTSIPEEISFVPKYKHNNLYGSINSDSNPQDDFQRLPVRPQHERFSSLAEESSLLKDELVSMITLAVPVIATYLLEMIPGIVTLILVGRMDAGEDSKLYVDSAALAVMLFNLVGMSTGLGLLTALDTLYSCAHGANETKKMGRYLLTGIVVMTVAFCIVWLALSNTTNVLLFFNQPEQLSQEAGNFAMWMLPGLPFLYGYELMRKLSQARNETLPMVVSAVCSVATNVCVGFYLVNFTSWGWLGAAVARTIGYMVLLPTLFVGMWYTDREFLAEVWSGCEIKEAITMKAISKFLNLGLPGLAQYWFEWGPYECIALICGLFPDKEEAIISIGANAIVLQIGSFIYMLYVGCSMSGNIRIGNALGSGDVHRAKMAAYLTLALGTLLAILNMCFLLSFRDILPTLFTTDEDLINKTRDLLIVISVYQLPDALNGVEQGLFRGIGKQAMSAKLNFIAYFIIGLPLGYILALPLGVGVEGLWIGMTIGLVFVSTVNTTIIFRCNWEELALETMKRLSIAGPIFCGSEEERDKARKEWQELMEDTMRRIANDVTAVSLDTSQTSGNITLDV